MAYQARRQKQFKEDFELLNENGEPVKVLHVLLDADDLVVKIHRKYSDLTRILSETTELRRQAESSEQIEQCFEKLGMAVVSLLEAVFGADDTEVIVDFYDNRYIEMCREVVPFITGVVIPRCEEIKRENRQSLLQSYNRKPNRILFRS